jgi:hypothetical protein
MHEIEKIAGRNAAYLEQGIDLIERVSKELYSGTPREGVQGIGPHFRHIVDHYDSLLCGLTSGRVDYDDRERNARLEADPRAMLSKLRELCSRLRRLGQGAHAEQLLVAMDCGEEEGLERAWSASTVLRELQFLVSHTVHHYAMIGRILAACGFAVSADFGMAPSTLRYVQRETACAP